jgi:2,3-bisphosphoglycerate-independent phosphoglycerate mutase
MTIISEVGVGRVSTVSGRYYAMDRDNRWERVEKAYNAIAGGEGLESSGALEAVTEAYERGETDEFVVPTVLRGARAVADGDTVIFFNFRSDRARELTRAFTSENFDGFARMSKPVLKSFITMTEYDKKLLLPALFSPKKFDNILAKS